MAKAEREAVATDLVRRLRAAGHEAYLAGGCVRDRLLGREPLDYDIATRATPERVQALFPRTIPGGVQFGVVLVIAGGMPVEVAPCRSDAAYVDGRRPSAVHFGSAREDALRRDFTVNALFLDPLTGDVVDFVGGEADLRAGIIRAIGDPRARIAEDRLRMLRAVRLAARLGFTIEPMTLEAICAASSTVTDMAAERIGDEGVKILTEGAARRGFELLAETSLLAAVLPEVARMRGVEQSPDYHPEGDVVRHTLLAIEQLPAGASETLALGLLLHDVGKPVTASRRGDRITFYGHATAGGGMAGAVCPRPRPARAPRERAGVFRAHPPRLARAPRSR